MPSRGGVTPERSVLLGVARAGSHATSISRIWTSGRCSRQKGAQRPSTSRFANEGSMPKAIKQLGFARAASSARQPRRSAMGPSSSMASACAFAVASFSKNASDASAKAA